MERTVTQLVNSIKRGNDSAVRELWQLYWTRLLRRAGTILNYTAVGSQSPEDLASEVFAEFIEKLRRTNPDVNDRQFVWAQLKLATWKRSLRWRQYEAADRRMKIWDLDSPDETVAARKLSEVDELIEELNSLPLHVNDVHERAREIMTLLISERKSAGEISDRLEIPIRTVYRVISNCRAKLTERWHG